MKCPKLFKILKNYYFLNYLLFLDKQNNGINYKSIIRVSLYFSILPTLVILGSALDNTFFLPGNGRGLMQHYGVWSLFLTAPIILLISIYTLEKFLSIMTKIENYLTNKEVPLGLKRIINAQIKSLSLNSKSKGWLLLFGLIGFFGSATNIIKTIDPMPTYGNDVFDSLPYYGGYVTNKAFLTFIWTVIYPISFFIILHISYSIIKILKYMYRQKILYIDFFNKDNCGGASEFGFINTLIMAFYMCIYIIFFCLFTTHAKDYFTLVLASISITIMMFVHNIWGVYFIQKLVKEKKNKYLDEINKKLFIKAKNLDYFSQDLLTLRQHILSVKPYPYTKAMSFFKNFFRFSPSLLALVKIILSP